MAHCPQCSSRIRLRTLLFSIRPTWITCGACRARLEGNIVVSFQSFVVLVLSLFGGGIVVSLARTYEFGIPGVTMLLACGVLGITIPSAVLSLKWGRFDLRD